MRQLLIQVPSGHGERAQELAGAHEATNTALLQGRAGDRPVEVLVASVPNHRVEALIAELQELPELHVTLTPRGVMPLRPPADEAAQQVADVRLRSPMEVYLGGLQSVGSWKGFLGYAFVAGIVVWIGLYTSTSYLLVAAMLIAPFAGPAMNTALASAVGNKSLLGRSLTRYFAALAVTIAVAALLSLMVGQEIASTAMVSTANLSSVAVLLPLAAGAAGALNLVQSERSSLVTGAATGMLVAASLAPPAGLLGMSLVIGRWDFVLSAGFVLFLQLLGIQFSGGLVFRLFGLSPQGGRFERGTRGVFHWVTGLSAVLLAGMLWWQFSDPISLQRSSRQQRAEASVGQVLRDSGLASLVEVNARFTRPDVSGQDTLLVTTIVQPGSAVDLPREWLEERLRERITRQLREEFSVVPLVDVTALRP